MKQKRTDKDVSNRASNMEQAEGSRETALENERMSGDEAMRNREAGSQDLGSSTDRAMFSDRGSSEGRNVAADHGIGGMQAERGMGSSAERNMGGSSGGGRNAGGITNRELDREQREQEQLPERGRSQSED